MIILGIHHNSHDAGAAIIKDGKILAAINEERLSRIKMDSSTPWQSIFKCLKITKIKESNVDIIAFSDMDFGIKRHFYFFWQQFQRVIYTRGKYLKSFLNKKTFSKGRFFKQLGLLALRDSFRTEKATKEIIKRFKQNGFVGKIRFVPHDLAHAAGAYYTGSFEKAFVAIVEGSSFTNTCSYWIIERNKLKKVFETKLPHSPGCYYEVVTLILGFHPKKHGGKITGLAAVGNSQKCYNRVKKLLYFKDGHIKVAPKLYQLHDEYFARGKKIPKLFKNEFREDVAAAFQKRLEDIVIKQFNYLAKKYDISNLVLSGGVFANVKLNMEISKIKEVKNIFIHPGMSDAGQALGVAFQSYASENKNFKPIKLTNIYFGPSYTDKEIEFELNNKKIDYLKPKNIAYETAKLLSKNKVIGFFQGRMEYGPRALGNRSILYPATDKSVNDWLNKQLKRTEFMPFAPVTLYEKADDCYKNINKSKHTAKFMTMAVEVTNFMKEKMSAAVHVDGTARPQLIDRQSNPLYYDVIAEYEKITGLPSIINTSFNMHEEPIVCTPKEAINAFIASNLDALVIGNFLVLR